MLHDNTSKSGGSSSYGTLFKIKPDGTGYAIMVNFSGTAIGGKPWGSLIYDGTFLYGMTAGGGAYNYGTAFRIKPDGTGYLKLHDFGNSTDGSIPYGVLYYDGTYLYGMTSQGL
ncbi:MAG TPA: choice-of-anchor tandem repeat GloVer-containing protein [Bacteroidia bacterium]